MDRGTTSYLASRPHPWHGLPVGPRPPEEVTVFVEITPFDRIKYELDKYSGFLRIDRPQDSSSLPPEVYGFVPRTLCGERVAALMPGAQKGDDDPLDICVISSHPILQSQVLLHARVIGGLAILDGGEADDKLISVLADDCAWGDMREIAEMPPRVIERLAHYFLTYKRLRSPGQPVSGGDVYGPDRAYRVVEAAIDDYRSVFGSAPAQGHGVPFEA